METSCSHSSIVDILQLHEGKNGMVRLKTTVYDIEKSVTTDSGATYLKPGEKGGVTVVVAKANVLRGCEQCRATITSCFLMPKVWWEECCRNANGYFGLEELRESSNSTAEKLSGLNSWARFQVKAVWQDDQRQGNEKAREILYDWDKLNVFARWYRATHHMALVLFDPRSDELQHSFTSAVLEPRPTPGELRDPFWIYPRLIQKMVDLEETSVWATRKLIRDVEKKRDRQERKKQLLDPQYSWLHEISRHVIHVSETLRVGAVSVESIQRHHEEFLELHGKSATGHTSMASRNIRNRLAFCHHMLKSSAHRAEANSARLQSEVTLAFNKVSQEDSNVSVQIAHYTRSDSAAMRTIAAVTMVFLPATFVSAIFSTTFFSSEGGTWTMSNKFWLFWAVAAPLTVCSFAIWAFCAPRIRPKPIDPSERLFRTSSLELDSEGGENGRIV